jgi:hypothetical protein
MQPPAKPHPAATSVETSQLVLIDPGLARVADPAKDKKRARRGAPVGIGARNHRPELGTLVAWGSKAHLLENAPSRREASLPPQGLP